jgi:hypothetical protein
MTTEETQKRNEAIALFMGVDYSPHPYFIGYHSSWDWLMPVVEKIEAEGGIKITIQKNVCIIKKYGFLEVRLAIEQISETKIEAVFLAVSDYCLNHK